MNNLYLEKDMINIYHLQNLIKTLAPNEYQYINISSSRLREFKNNPGLLNVAKFETVRKLHEYFYNKQYYVIGIDIGDTSFITACNEYGKDVFINDNKKLHAIISKTVKKINKLNKEKVNKHVRLYILDAFYQLVKDEIHQELDKLLQFYPNDTLFVMGKHLVNKSHMSVFSRIYLIIVEYLSQKLDDNNRLYTIDESGTSIICPVCGHQHSKNRTHTNRFNCKKCNYRNDNDDIVAAQNICKRFINNNSEV